jgi:hypothetical protein
VATEHTPADDMIYDLISVQYHALKAAQSADKYVQDAHEHDDVRQFFDEVAEQDRQRALRCHELLGKYAASRSLAMS